MAQLYEREEDDPIKIEQHLLEMETYSDAILIRQYNRLLRLGLRDFHFQKLYALALRIEFLRRFGKSPINLEENHIIRLTDEIELA